MLMSCGCCHRHNATIARQRSRFTSGTLPQPGASWGGSRPISEGMDGLRTPFTISKSNFTMVPDLNPSRAGKCHQSMRLMRWSMSTP